MINIEVLQQLQIISVQLLFMLVELTIKGSIVLVIAWSAIAIFRKASAAARHIVWTAALLSTLVFPALTWFMPELSCLVEPADFSAVKTMAFPGPR